MAALGATPCGVLIGIEDRLREDLHDLAAGALDLQEVEPHLVLAVIHVGQLGDVVILDVDADPDLKLLRRLTCEERSAPVVVLAPRSRTRRELAVAPCVHVLPKPVDAAEVLIRAVEVMPARGPWTALTDFRRALEARLRY